MALPEDRRYARSHTWVKEEGEALLVGLTEYALDDISGLIFIGLPEPGESVRAGECFARLESMKAAVEIASPVNGVVCEANDVLMQYPPSVDEKPYETWLIRVKPEAQAEGLLSAKDYMEWAESEIEKDEE